MRPPTLVGGRRERSRSQLVTNGLVASLSVSSPNSKLTVKPLCSTRITFIQYLEAGKFEEVLLFRHFQQMILDEGVHLGQNSGISHRAGKVTKRDGVLGIHLRQQIVATNLRSECDKLTRVNYM